LAIWKNQFNAAFQTAICVWLNRRRASTSAMNSRAEATAENLVSFKISGPGEIAAVDNGDNAGHEPFQASARHAFEGECVAFVKAAAGAGRIVLTATAAGLDAGSVTLEASP
jgi:hypothetical protein